MTDTEDGAGSNRTSLGKSAPPPYPSSGSSGYGYPSPAQSGSSVRGLGIAIVVLLVAQGVALLGSLVPLWHQRDLLQRLAADPRSVTFADADASDNVVAATAGIWVLLFVATGVVWIIWFFRVRRNAGIWGPNYQRRSQGWSIGGWFCPIVNLWFPAMIAKDALDATDHESGGSDYPLRGRRPLVLVWWLSFLASSVTGRIAARIYDSSDPDTFVTSANWDLVDAVVTALAVIPAVLLVRELTGRQTTRIESERARPERWWGGEPGRRH